MSYIELSPSIAGGTGDVVGPASSVANRIASFSGTTGKLLQDSGVLSTSVVQGPASSVADRVATYSDTTGKLIKDSGTLISGLAALTQVVRYDAAQSLTAAQATQGRSNIYATPLDALAYSGMQINGSMDVSQERGTTATTVAGNFACDGWRLQFSGAMAMMAGIASGVFSEFSSYVYATNTNAPALGSGDYVILRQSIEGYRISRLGWGTINAQPITIGFWSANTPAGVYSGVIRNEANNRNYAFNYTQNVALTPEYKIVTIPGETNGGWSVGNTTGMDIIFAFAVGSTNTAPSANVWSAGNYLAAPGQVNGIASSGNALRITGLVVLPGIEAPSAARSPLIMRPYDQELLTCQRYYERYPLAGNYTLFAIGQAVSATAAQVGTFFKAVKRAAPTLLMSAAGEFVVTGAAGAVNTVTGLTTTYSGPSSVMLSINVTGGLVAGNACSLNQNAAVASLFALDARL